MTQEEIQHQIEVIKRATAKALKSPEASRKFLLDAGITEEDLDELIKSANPKKKKKQ